jgi:hypothetical protein
MKYILAVLHRANAMIVAYTQGALAVNFIG